MRRLGCFAGGVVEAGWLSVALLVPLFIDKNAAEVFEPAKAQVLRALAVLMLLGWAIRTLAMPHEDAKPSTGEASPLSRFLRAPLWPAIVLVVLSTSIASWLSVIPRESVWGHVGRSQGLITLLAGVAIFAATAANLTTRAQLVRLVDALILPSVPIAMYALFQRIGYEPLYVAVRETETQRVTSLLGQPVFLGAYLAMIFPFTALRAALLVHARRIGAGALFVLLGLLQTAALVLSESRGPTLGLAVGVIVGVLAVGAVRHARRTVLALAALGVLVGLPTVIFLSRANVSTHAQSGDTEEVRIARRAADTFTVSGSGGNFRLANWQVAARVLQRGTPLLFSDETRDPRPTLRPFVGYGPETQYAISPPFYDEELVHMFGYFVMDRYHNALWDTVVTTGAFGLAASLALQAALFHLLLRVLGLIASKRRHAAFWATYLGGASVGVAIAVAARGVPLSFLGLQLGAVAGVALFLAGTAVGRRSLAPRPSDRTWEVGLIIAVLAAAVAHFIELSFSFTIVATGALFWIACALALVCARRLSAPDVQEEDGPERAATLMDGALLGLAMIALGFAFLGGPSMPRRPGAVLWDGLTYLSQPEHGRFPVVALVAGATLVLGAILLSVSARPGLLGGARRAGAIAAIAFGFAFVYWMRLSFILAQRAVPVKPKSLIVAQALEIRESSQWSVYAFGLLAVLVIAWARARAEPPRDARQTLPNAPLRSALSLACVPLAIWAVFEVALQPAAASAAVALGDGMRDRDELELAEDAYARARAIAPDDDGYAAALAKAYTKHGRRDAARAASWFERADQTMREAIAKNRVATEHATNIAVIRALWAQRAPAPQAASLRETVPSLYRQAIRQNPQDPNVWRLWTSAQLSLLHDPAGALASAERALVLEPYSAESNGLMGDARVAVARLREGPTRKQLFLAAAVAYARAAESARGQPVHRANEGKAYLEAGEPGKAIAALRSALSRMPASSPARKSATAALRRAESAVAMVTPEPPASAP